MTRHTWRPGGATYYPMDGARQRDPLEPDDVIAALDAHTEHTGIVDAMAQEIENLRAELDGRAPVTNNPNDPNMKREGFTLPCGGMTVNWVGESGNIVSSQEHKMQAAHSWEPNTYGHWSPWLEWRGGPCPLPPDVPVDTRSRREIEEYVWRAGKIDWSHDRPDESCRPHVIRFRYRADNPAGWLPRGKFIPPAELWDDGCPVRCEWINAAVDSSAVQREQMTPSTWSLPTHIRLVARQPQAGLPEGWSINEDGNLVDPRGVIFEARQSVSNRYDHPVILQAVKAWLREMGDE